ncbi:glutamine-synthetase adenylyltransferase [Pseudooceanicola sp. C21-150M6]|uniref:[protein-PII] uridylyltransferase family protein n=1 Tax=Pseudooceanicola sp. C21-150M6 TaxID=3434355 RepID=UPI003D7F4F5C
MSFAARMTRCPRPFEPDRATDARQALDLAGPLGDLIAGAGGSSPYLLTLIQKEADWIGPALDDPETALAEEFARLRALPEEALKSGLRQGKRRLALLIALADLAGVWPLEQVTGHLTEFADLACDLALGAALAPLQRRGKLPGVTEEDLETGAGMVILAMGKMGAGELNYSSDIDLISLFDEERHRDTFDEVRAGFIRATRTMAATLSDITDEGYVFRTDLRLRPDPSVTPVCLSLEAAERYYESLGRTWERAAYIKARPCAGDLAAGDRFLEALRPFVWRRHLDYAAIRDAHDMRRAMRDHKGLHGAITLPGHDLKLGRGGIREVEFFAQFHQLIAGGRDPGLRSRGTVESLTRLADARWIPADVAPMLAGHYRALREAEHRVQMVNDAQTHALPGSDEGIARIACLSDMEPAAFRKALKARLEEVHATCERFFAGEAQKLGVATAPTDLPVDDALVTRWRSYPALRSARAQEIFQRLRPRLLEALSRAARPEEALAAFDGFLAGLPAGVQLFSLFEANPQLIDLLGDITGTAPDLALYLSRNSGVFDAVIGGSFFADWPGAEALTAQLTRTLSREPDYETRLDAARRWQKEWHFRVGVHHLRALIPPEEAARQYTDLADAVLRALWPEVQANFATRHGPPPGRGAIVLGMGSLGARRLSARSDLDLIVIYDADGQEASEGRRPLPARTYYARLTQALVTALSAPTAEGRLYEVDMRLRPSGNQGPVATSLAAFREYQEDKAWVWEHMALTLARPVTGPDALMEEVESFRHDLLSRPRDAETLRLETAEMRARIAQAKGAGADWDMKLGRGRMQEIELLSQAGALAAARPDADLRQGLEGAEAAGWLPGGGAATLAETHALLSRLHQTAKLLSDKPLDPDALGQGGCARLQAAADVSDRAALEALLTAQREAAGEMIDQALHVDKEDGADA